MHELLRTLIELTLASSAATAIALLIRKPVQRMFGAQVAYVVWLCVPIALVAALLPAGVINAPVLHVPVSVDALLQFDSPTTASLISASSAEVATHLSFDWTVWTAAAWVVGALIFLAYLVGLQHAYLRTLGALFEHDGTLRAEQPAGCPAVVGVFRPRLILPADFESRYTHAEQSLVLAHERVHLHRADAMWNALVALVRCVFWFNPLVHYAARRFRVDQELSCDATVMQQHPDARRVYADAMLKTQLADGALPAGCHWRSAHPLKERLMMLKHPAPGRARRAIGSAFVVALSMAVGYAAWAAEPAMPAPPPPPQVSPAEPQPPPPASPSPADLRVAPVPPAPPGPSTEPVPPAPPAAPIEPTPPVPPVDTPELVPTVAPVSPAEVAAPAVTAALEWSSAVPSGRAVTVTADAVDQTSDQEVELRHVTLAVGDPPHQTMISADRGRRTSEGGWLFEGNVLVQTEKEAVRADQIKFTRDGALMTSGAGPASVTTRSSRAE